MAKAPTIEVRNVTSPDHVYRVDESKYNAMKDAMMAVLPDAAPGMTPAEIKQAILPILSQELFPGGDKAGWWIKCVQLDLEAKSVLERTDKPVRLYPRLIAGGDARTPARLGGDDGLDQHVPAFHLGRSDLAAYLEVDALAPAAVACACAWLRAAPSAASIASSSLAKSRTPSGRETRNWPSLGCTMPTLATILTCPTTAPRALATSVSAGTTHCVPISPSMPA